MTGFRVHFFTSSNAISTRSPILELECDRGARRLRDHALEAAAPLGRSGRELARLAGEASEVARPTQGTVDPGEDTSKV